MKTFIKTIKTTLAVLSIILGLTALFTLDNNQSITTLIFQVFFMILGITVGISLLITIYPELSDLSEFEEADKRVFEEYEKELAELREHNLLLIDRYITFKKIIIASRDIDESNKEKYPNLYRIIYEEDLRIDGNRLKPATREELDRFKEIYN